MPDPPFESVSAGAAHSAWAPRLVDLARELHDDLSTPEREAVRGKVWPLLHSVVIAYLERHCRRYGRIDLEDMRDIAVEKSLDLLRRLDSVQWKPQDVSVGETQSFVSVVSRNGLIDFLRRSSRLTAMPDNMIDSLQGKNLLHPSREPEKPDATIEREHFTAALSECLSYLKPRDRTIWFFRAFYELTSKTIAAHPEVQLRPSHVDVILQRARERLRDCMETKGYDPTDIPRGTFSTLWMTLRSQAPPPEGEPS